MAEIKTKRGCDLLSDKTATNAKPQGKDYLLSDGKCLYLNIKSIGTKVWTIKYTLKGTRHKTTIGNYPAVTLANARKKRNEFLEKVANGINPTVEKRENKQAIIEEVKRKEMDLSKQFHIVALEWLDGKFKESVGDTTYNKTKRAVERDILPVFATFKPNANRTFENVLSSKSMDEIKHPEITDAIITKSKTALDTAYRLVNICDRLWRYAKGTGRADTNIIAGNFLASDILPKLEKTPYPSTTDKEKIKQILDFADNYKGSAITKTALRLLPYVFVRMANLQAVKWTDIDFDKKIWIADKHKTSDKTGTAILPLPTQAIAILNDFRKTTGHCIYIFPQLRDFTKPMSDNTVSKAFRDSELKGVIVPHGFRSMFKSLAEQHSDKHGLNPKAIEACLFHKTEKTAVGHSYGHMADYTAQMTILMDWWADFLDEIKSDHLDTLKAGG
jgi:integrase